MLVKLKYKLIKIRNQCAEPFDCLKAGLRFLQVVFLHGLSQFVCIKLCTCDYT